MEPNSMIKRWGVYQFQRPRLNHWVGLCEKWAKAIKKYSKRWEGDDASYWHNEQANVSVLSGAAYKLGWVGLCEARVSRKSQAPGRTDLYLISKDHHECVEAKMTWINSSPGDTNKFKKIESKRIEALDQLQDPIEEWECDGVTVVFAAVYRKEGDESWHPGDLVRSILKYYQADSKDEKNCPDLVAWSFPKTTTNLLGYKNYYNPGVVLIAKSITG